MKCNGIRGFTTVIPRNPLCYIHATTLDTNRYSRQGAKHAKVTCVFLLHETIPLNLSSFAHFAPWRENNNKQFQPPTLFTVNYSLLSQHRLQPQPYILHNPWLCFCIRMNAVLLHQIPVFSDLVEHARYQWNSKTFR